MDATRDIRAASQESTSTIANRKEGDQRQVPTPKGAQGWLPQVFRWSKSPAVFVAGLFLECSFAKIFQLESGVHRWQQMIQKKRKMMITTKV